MTKNLPAKHIVLYADDDIDDIELVKEAFFKYSRDVEVITFEDGNSLLRYVSELSPLDAKPCLVILDYNMPLLNGKETLIRLRDIEGYESLPVVMFTTSSMAADKQFANKWGAGFITKPLDTRQMRYITEQFIDHCSDEIRNKIRRV